MPNANIDRFTGRQRNATGAERKGQTPAARILIIEDDESFAGSLKKVLEVNGYEVATAATAAQGVALVQDGDFQVVITDWNLQTPGASGMEVVKTLHECKPRLPVIFMTGQHTATAAIEATKLGAYDYVVKSPDLIEDLLGRLEKAVVTSRLMSEPVKVTESVSGKDVIIGSSRKMLDVFIQIGRVAATPATVLIRGETGTGKELVARAICQQSNRADQPFVEVLCAAIPENLLESELFGHEPGAFTDAKVRRIGRFEQADHGTIFLDEVGDMSLNTQTKLLRVLQNKQFQRLGGQSTIEVDVRVIAATHRDLEQAIREKQFRQDLYYRLNDVVIHLPPLRERTEDIPELVDHFLNRFSAEFGLQRPQVDPAAIRLLQAQPWPGNVRELQNLTRKLLLLGRATITASDVTELLASAPPPRSDVHATLAGRIAELLAAAKAGKINNVQEILLAEMERELYSQAIQLANGDQTRAAAWLGVSRPTMREKLARYGLHPTKTLY